MEDFIYQLSKEILSDLSLDKMLLNVSDKIKDYIGAERASLFVYDPERNSLNSVVLLADSGKIKNVQIPVAKESIAGFTAISGRTVNIKDVHDFEELRKIDPQLRYHSPWVYIPDVKTTSMISIPVKKDGKLLGVFQAINKEGGFTQEDEKVLEKLSPLIAIAIERALFINRLEMLRATEKTILDNIMEGVVLIDLDLRIKEMNASFIEMLGYRYSEEELLGADITKFIPALKEYRKKLEFAVENEISEEIFIGMMRIKIIPVEWNCLHKKEIKYIALIFSFSVGRV